MSLALAFCWRQLKFSVDQEQVAARRDGVAAGGFEVAAAEAVAVAEGVVDLHQDFVGVVRAGNGTPARSCPGRLAIGMYLLRMFMRGGIEAGGRDDVAREGRVVVVGIGGRGLGVREIALCAPAPSAQSRRLRKTAGDLPQAGVGSEEEGLVLADGAAEGAAELIAMQRRGRSASPTDRAFRSLLRKNSKSEP